VNVFTGIIEAMAPVLHRTGAQLTIGRPVAFTDVQIGSSISVAGVCLSVAAIADASMTFDVVPETWERTTLSQFKEGDRVNLERALPAGGRFEGHVVQGHVEGVGTVTGNRKEGTGRRVTISVPDVCSRFIVPKGSIAIDGVSLTVASVEGRRCAVALIPQTRANTTLGSLESGDRVNIETDVLVRTVATLVPSSAHDR